MSESVQVGAKWSCAIIIIHEGTEGGATMDTHPAHRGRVRTDRREQTQTGVATGGSILGGSGPQERRLQADAAPKRERPPSGSAPQTRANPRRSESKAGTLLPIGKKPGRGCHAQGNPMRTRPLR